jgi:lactate dehydrogenase-like 2-hydroxyacid dehydrogenase
MPIDILQLVPFRPEVQKELAARYRLHQLDSLGEAAGAIRGIVTNGHSGPGAELIDRLPKLEIIASASVGYDTIAVEHARARGIPVTNTPDVLNNDVADLAIALILMTARRLMAADAFVRAGKWRAGELPLGESAGGKRLGIVGLGRIGKAVARRAAAMEMEIAYTGRRKLDDVPYRYEPDLTALARDSDFLAVIVPLTEATRGMIDGAVLEALGPGGILINVARGAVVDEAAMVAALESGKLGGAGLDVFADEPNVPDALLGMENVVLAPHVGSATLETRRAMSQLTLDNLDAHFAGRPLLTPV